MKLRERAFDICLAAVLTTVIAIPFLMVFVVHMFAMGRPYFHKSERMRSPSQAFALWKLRSMRPVPEGDGISGGDKIARIPRWGQFLRTSRLDEVPQLWNVLSGDMRLIGPRPPLRIYVARFPGHYASVLKVPPGITGLATLAFHRHERRLLANCATAAETDAAYARRCIPRKARMDAIYQQRKCLQLDILILCWTLLALTRRPTRLLRPRVKVRATTVISAGRMRTSAGSADLVKS